MIEWDRYNITRDGRIFDLKRNGKEKKTHFIDGYKYCVLRNEGDSRREIQFAVHRLVAMFYCNDYFEGCHVHHIDGNRINNNVENLKCMTIKEHLQMHKEKYSKDKTMICPVCKKEFIWTHAQQVRYYNRPNKNSKGPFCSSKCALDFARTKRIIAPLKNPQDYGIA